MKFIDEVKISVMAGGGGSGCVSFRREKFVARGGPNGGNGGDGGSVIVVANSQLMTLLDLSYQKQYRAGRGVHGRGKDQHGKRGKDRTITVPVGTLVRDTTIGAVLADLNTDGERVVVATGGKGGKGNAFFVSSTNQSPRRSQPGLPGEEKELQMELRLLADVGIIGLPNAGKSTLVSSISAARPKIADYPFTTLVPNLGVVSYGDRKSCVLADIPGIIVGAHRGEGLGDKFLRHVIRTVLLIHLLDTSKIVKEDPLLDFYAIIRELELFSPKLAKKPQIIVASKLDLTEARARLPYLESATASVKLPFCAISALTGQGLIKLKRLIEVELDKARVAKEGTNATAGV